MAIFTDIFDDVTKFGKKIHTKEYLEKGKYPIIDQGHSHVAGYTNEEDGLFTNIPVVVFGDHTRILKYVDVPFFLGADGVKVLKAKSNDANYKYLYYALSSVKIPDTGYNRHFKWLKETNIPNHSVQEQKQIVEELDKLCLLIKQRKQQLSELDKLVKARFVEMFGDPVENSYGWKQTTLKNVAIGKLSYGSGASACEYDGNIRYVRITDIDNNGKLNNDIVSPNFIEEKYILNDGDILFARSGATVGKTYRYRENDGKCLYAGYLIRLVPNTEMVLPDYVFYYTKTSYYEGFISSNMKVVAQPNINAQQYGNLTICIPPLDLQKEFLSYVEQVDKSKFEVQQSLKKLETLKKSLMQQYFG